MKLQSKLVVCIFILFSLLLTACKDKESKYKSDDKLGYLAYDEYQDDENLIYLEEKDGYQPYIVLTNNYDGKTLLLRKYLLNDFIRMNEYYAKYEGCEMDTYLKNDFFDILSNEVQQKIEETEIVVTHQAWQGKNDNGKTYLIKRKVFLLSCAELGFTTKYVVQKEGKKLKYFKKDENWFAYLENDNTRGYPWWLRTNDTMSESCFWFVAGSEAIVSRINSFDTNAVRPAFCLNSDLEIEKTEKVIDGQSVYALKS